VGDSEHAAATVDVPRPFLASARIEALARGQMVSIYWRRNYFLSGLTSAIICILATASFATHQKSATNGAKNSVEERTLTFPQSGSIGVLTLIPHHNFIGNEKAIGTAIGTVKAIVPKGSWLGLELNRQAVLHPKLLDSCSTIGVDALNISFMSMEDGDVGWSDAALQHANHFKSLKCLLLNKSDVSDQSVSGLRGLPDIECISAFLTGINGDCFKTFSQYKNLQYLICSEDPIRQENLRYLSECPRLSYVDLRRTELGEPGVKYLRRCPNISTLRIGNNSKVNDACIKYLLNLRHLKSLGLENTAVTYSGLKALKPLNLQILSISEGACDGKDLPALKSLATKIQFVPRLRVDRKMEQMFDPVHY